MNSLIFSAEMIRSKIIPASLRPGSEWQTRRICKLDLPSTEAVRAKSGSDYHWMHCADMGRPQIFRPTGPVWAVRDLGGPMSIKCPYGQPDDILYVRETWRPRQIDADGQYRITYTADGHFRDFPGEQIPDDWKEPKAASRGNVSPLFMPAWAARHFIKLTAVRVERLWEISEADCIAEGAPCIDNEDYDPDEPGDDLEQSYRAGFADLWRRINGPESWDENPWVWALSFELVGSEVRK